MISSCVLILLSLGIMAESRVIRDQMKCTLVRSSTSLKRLLAEQDIGGVQDCLNRMKSTFDKLEASHYAYLDVLTDDAEISNGEKWFDDVLSKYIENVNKAKKWLRNVDAETVVRVTSTHSVGDVSVTSQNSVSSEIAAAISLPKIDIKKFHGNPKHYQSFITAFDEIIADRLSDDRSKLIHLMSNLSGEAYTAVQSCSVMNATAGYARAREILKERYGNAYVVSQSLLHDLRYGMKITKSQDLRILADNLIMTKHTLQSIGAYQEVDNQNFIRDIIDRCPPKTRDKWCNFALERKETRGTYPLFNDLCEYINREAERACDAVYGTEQRNIRNHAFSTESGSTNLSRQTNHSKDCIVCNGKHGLPKCDKFKAMSPDQRFKIVRDNRLCFSCLEYKHMAKSCLRRSSCYVSGCKKNHHGLLHMERQYSDVGRAPYGSQVQSAGANSPHQPAPAPVIRSHACSTNRGSERIYLPVVPVMVRGKMVNCLLDSGSSATLATRQLYDELGIQGREVCCRVDTVGTSDTLTTNSIDLTIHPLTGDRTVDLQNILVVSDIPAEMPSSDTVDIDRYPYLRDLPLHLPKSDVKVDILIGMDHPDLLLPLEVRCDESKPGSPFATRTRLGWALQGPFGGKSRSAVEVNFLNVRDPDLTNGLQNLWNIENSDEDLCADSVQDKHVIDMWKRDIEFVNGHYQLPVPWIAGIS